MATIHRHDVMIGAIITPENGCLAGTNAPIGSHRFLI